MASFYGSLQRLESLSEVQATQWAETLQAWERADRELEADQTAVAARVKVYICAKIDDSDKLVLLAVRSDSEQKSNTVTVSLDKCVELTEKFFKQAAPREQLLRALAAADQSSGTHERIEGTHRALVRMKEQAQKHSLNKLYRLEERLALLLPWIERWT